MDFTVFFVSSSLPKGSHTKEEIKEVGQKDRHSQREGEVGQIGPIGRAAADKKKTCREGESLVLAQGTAAHRVAKVLVWKLIEMKFGQLNQLVP